MVLNARDAAARGAEIRTRTRFERAEPRRRAAGGCASPTAARGAGAKAVVNAGGPWVGELIREGFGGESAARVRLVRGSHIVTRRLFEHDRAYIFQQADGRVVFAIPYEEDFTLIGTTDVEHEGAPGDGGLHAGGARLPARARRRSISRAPVGAEDIVWSYSGVRPLYDDGATSATAATRDYVIKLRRDGGAAAVDVFGGKITTYRRLAEAVMAQARATSSPGCAAPGRRGCRFRAATFRWAGPRRWRRELARRFPFLDAALGRAAGPRLRHRGARRCWPAPHGCGPRRAVRLGPDRARGALADGARMGADRRGRALAPDQARAPADAGEAARLEEWMARARDRSYGRAAG